MNADNILEEFRTYLLLYVYDQVKDNKISSYKEINKNVCILLEENNIINLAIENYRYFLSDDLLNIECYWKISNIINSNDYFLINSFKLMIFFIKTNKMHNKDLLEIALLDCLINSKILNVIFTDLSLFIDHIKYNKRLNCLKTLEKSVNHIMINNSFICNSELCQYLIILMQKYVIAYNYNNRYIKVDEALNNINKIERDEEKDFILSVCNIINNNIFIIDRYYTIVNFVILFLFEDPGNCKNLLK